MHVDLIDDEGNTVEPGTVGEIVLRTGMEALRYVRRVEHEKSGADKTVWDNDIYHTGDTAWRDEDGYFWYVGRTDDIIKFLRLPDRAVRNRERSHGTALRAGMRHYGHAGSYPWTGG